MNKIFNWTFGSLFRTIGRLLGFLIVCILLLLIGSKLGLKIPDFLMPMKISADEVEYTFSTNQSNVCVDDHGTQRCGGWKNNPYDDNLNYPLELIKYRVKLNDGWLKDNVYTINVGYKPTPDAIHVSSLRVCWENSGDCENFTSQNGWNKNSSGYYRNIFSFSPTVDHSSSEYLYIYVEFIPGYLTTIRPSLLNTLSVARGTDAIIKDQTNQIIDSQNQTNEKLDNIEDSITNNDSSGATSEAGGFFENFNTETFGLTSIITAPLNAINNILNSSCSSLSIPLPFVNKNIILPCMTSIYTNYFGAFFQLYQLITTGIISYYIIVRIFNLVKDFKNPEHDEIEVVDL